MTKYVIVHDICSERLEGTVNAKLSQGWTLVGGVSCVNTGMGLRWVQTMMIEAAEAAGGGK